MSEVTTPEQLRQAQIMEAIRELNFAYKEAGLVESQEKDDLENLARRYLAGEKERLLEIKAKYEKDIEECDKGVDPLCWRHATNVVEAINRFISIIDGE